jgi:ADP-heptose:LPS heptosyltransferase
MRIHTLYTIDQKLFGLLVRFIPIKKRKSSPAPSEWRRVAISKYVGMGSIVLTTPLTSTIRRGCDGVEVSLVTLKQHCELALMLGYDKCFKLDASSVGRALASFPKLLKGLRSWSPDAFFELEFFSNAGALIAFLSGAPVRVGFHHAQSPRARLLTHFVPITPRHTSELFLAQAWSVGIEVPSAWHLERPSYDLKKVREHVLHLPRPFIVVNPNAGELSLQRRWHGERFLELIMRLLNAYKQIHICTIGSKEEVAYVRGILGHLEGHERVHNLAGKLNLHELCMLIDEALLLLTNDSGPMHLAAALGTPCVAIFGPESPTHYAPLGNYHRIIYKALPCSPCLNPYDGKMFQCPFGKKCMELVSVDEVFEEVASLIEGRLKCAVG